MKRRLQTTIIAAALRLVHAAIVELQRLDPEVAGELSRMPVGMTYAIHTGHHAPSLIVQWDGQRLLRLSRPEGKKLCTLRLKALAISFRLFTGQMGLAHAYAQHAFTLSGEIADVMRLARLVNRAEAYLFPPILSRRILPDLPELPVSRLRVYVRVFIGFFQTAC